MITVVFYLLVLIGVSWVQIHYFTPMETKKEWSIYISAMVVVFGIGAVLILNWDVPSPMSGLRGVVEPIGRTILH